MRRFFLALALLITAARSAAPGTGSQSYTHQCPAEPPRSRARETPVGAMTVGAFAAEILAAGRSGRLPETFGWKEVRQICPGRARSTYASFLANHARTSDGFSELFIRVASGRYRLRPELLNATGATASCGPLAAL